MHHHLHTGERTLHRGGVIQRSDPRLETVRRDKRCQRFCAATRDDRTNPAAQALLDDQLPGIAVGTVNEQHVQVSGGNRTATRGHGQLRAACKLPRGLLRAP